MILLHGMQLTWFGWRQTVLTATEPFETWKIR